MQIVWSIALMIVTGVAYYWGYSNGAEQRLSEEAQLDLEKYKYDVFYAHERWKEERKYKHELPAP